jgi:putative sigma-54 modulation protein
MRMKVNVQSVNFNIDQKLVDFTQIKVDNLEKYYDKIIGAVVYLKLQNTSDKVNKIAEIKLKIAGDELIVKKLGKTFEEGIDLAVDSLKRQLNKKKEMQRAHHI